MIRILFSLDIRKRSILIKWDRFLSFTLENGKTSTAIFGVPLPFRLERKKFHFPIRWMHWRRIFSFLKEWRFQKVEGTFSFSDPMINGILYGWMSALGTDREDRRIRVGINFLGENRCSGEVTIFNKRLLHHLKEWFFSLIRKRR